MLIALLIPLAMAILVYALLLTRAVIARRATPTAEALALGAVVNFFDTFGISSFAQTTAWMKFRQMVPDRLIPPTMIAGLAPPAMAESIVFLVLLGVRRGPDVRRAVGVAGRRAERQREGGGRASPRGHLDRLLCSGREAARRPQGAARASGRARNAPTASVMTDPQPLRRDFVKHDQV